MQEFILSRRLTMRKVLVAAAAVVGLSTAAQANTCGAYFRLKVGDGVDTAKKVIGSVAFHPAPGEVNGRIGYLADKGWPDVVMIYDIPGERCSLTIGYRATDAGLVVSYISSGGAPPKKRPVGR